MLKLDYTLYVTAKARFLHDYDQPLAFFIAMTVVMIVVALLGFGALKLHEFLVFRRMKKESLSKPR